METHQTGDHVLVTVLVTNAGYWKHVEVLAGHQQQSQRLYIMHCVSVTEEARSQAHSWG